MRKLFYVDAKLCGAELQPEDFDLEEFCEILQGKISDVEIVAVTEPGEEAVNRDPSLAGDHLFNEALGEYLHH